MHKTKEESNKKQEDDDITKESSFWPLELSFILK